MSDERRKEKFFSHYWVESRHDYLMSLSPEHARRLLADLNDDEIASNVNRRKFQEDYICDFLEHVWGVSTSSFWKHVRIAMKHPEGLVIGQNDFVLSRLRKTRLPLNIWQELLNSIDRLDGEFPADLLEDILRAQLDTRGENSVLLNRFLLWLSSLEAGKKKRLMQRLGKEFARKLPRE